MKKAFTFIIVESWELLLHARGTDTHCFAARSASFSVNAKAIFFLQSEAFIFSNGS